MHFNQPTKQTINCRMLKKAKHGSFTLRGVKLAKRSPILTKTQKEEFLHIITTNKSQTLKN